MSKKSKSYIQTVSINLELPHEWEFVEYRVPQIHEFYFSDHHVCKCMDITDKKRFVIQRKPMTGKELIGKLCRVGHDITSIVTDVEEGEIPSQHKYYTGALYWYDAVPLTNSEIKNLLSDDLPCSTK